MPYLSVADYETVVAPRYETAETFANPHRPRKAAFITANRPRVRTSIPVAVLVISLSLSFSFVATVDSAEQPEQQRRLVVDDSTSVPYSFLGFPVVHHPPSQNHDDTPSFASTVHCVGDDFRNDDAWMYRSCQFWNLCWNVETKQFLYFASREEVALQEILAMMQPSNLVSVNSMAWSNDKSQAHIKSMSLKTLRTVESITQQSQNQKWFPEVVSDAKLQQALLANGYYQLPDDVTLFPFQKSTTSSSHVRWLNTWMDCFAMHTLLSMFGLEHKRPAVLLYGADNEGDSNGDDDSFPIELLPVFGIQEQNFGTRDSAALLLLLQPPKQMGTNTENVKPQSNLVCAKSAVAGLGMMATTHQLSPSSNGYDDEAPLLTHTIGRGVALYAFRQYVLRNLGLAGGGGGGTSASSAALSDAALTTTKVIIAYEFPVQQGQWPKQVQGRLQQDWSVQSKFNHISIQLVDVQQLDIHELALHATQASVYIAQTGLAHTLVAATLLSRDSTLIVLEIDANDSATESEKADDLSQRRSSQRSEQYILESAGYFIVQWMVLKHTTLDDGLLDQVVALVQKGIDEPTS